MGKRANKYPGVCAGSTSSILVTFYYQGTKYRERVKAVPTPANLRIAAGFRQEILAAIADGSFDYATTFPHSKRAARIQPQHTEPDKLLVGDLLNRWYDQNCHRLKRSTAIVYLDNIRRQLLPAFGNIPVAELTKARVKDWVYGNDCRITTSLQYLSVLRSAFNDAVADDLIPTNPIAGLRIRAPRIIKTDPIDPFDAAERATILGSLAGAERNMVEFWFWTGLRSSEIVALEWGDIDWVHNKIHITKAKTDRSNGVVEGTKTQASTRFIELLKPAKDALLRQKEHTLMAGKLVFVRRDGEPYAGARDIRDQLWTRALRKAGVRYRYPYQCRHTYATMLLDAGENIRWISAQLGHTNWTFTARVYTRFMPQSFADAGSKAVEKFGECPASAGPLLKKA